MLLTRFCKFDIILMKKNPLIFFTTRRGRPSAIPGRPLHQHTPNMRGATSQLFTPENPTTRKDSPPVAPPSFTLRQLSSWRFPFYSFFCIIIEYEKNPFDRRRKNDKGYLHHEAETSRQF